MRALLARDIEGDLEFVLGPAQVRDWNTAQHEPAFIAREVGYAAALEGEEQATAVGIAEI